MLLAAPIAKLGILEEVKAAAAPVLPIQARPPLLAAASILRFLGED
jgi:hypothetical protein